MYTPFFSITRPRSQIRKKLSSEPRSVHIVILPSSTLQELEVKQYTQHLQFKKKRKGGAIQYTQHLQLHKNRSQAIHTTSSGSQKMGTRQVTHTHVHTRTHTHARARVRARTHTLLNTINSIARSGIQTVKTQSIFSNTRTRCQTFGYELSSPSVDLRRCFHCSHVALEQLSKQHAGLLFLIVTYIDLLTTQKPPTSDRHLHRPFNNTKTAHF